MKHIILFIVFFLLTETLFPLDNSLERQAEILNERGLASLESNLEKALRNFKQAHSLVKTVPDYISNIGVVYAKKKQYYKALPYFLKATQVDPNYTPGYYNQGVCYQRLGQNRKAIRFYKKAIRIDPMYWPPYYNLGLVYSRVGDKRNAILYYQRVLEVAPKSFPKVTEYAKKNIQELSQ